MGLVRLIYVSTMAERFSGLEIDKILTQSRNNNKKNQISGILFFNRNNAIQCLEGNAEAVNKLYAKIIQDDRHEAATLIDYRAICKREFSNWSMGYVAETIKTKEVLKPYFVGDDFNCYELGGESAMHVLCALAKMIPTE